MFNVRVFCLKVKKNLKLKEINCQKKLKNSKYKQLKTEQCLMCMYVLFKSFNKNH